MGSSTALVAFLVIFATVDLLHASSNPANSISNGISVIEISEPQDAITCQIDLNKDLTFEHPVIIDRKTNNFLLPGPNGIVLNVGDKVLLACTGENNNVAVAGKQQELELECVGGNIFQNTILGYKNAFKTFTCNRYPDPSARKTGKKCSGKYTEIEIGFTVSTGFLSLITTCLDETKRDTLYSIFNLVGSINRQQVRVPRPDGFEEGGFYPGLYPTPSGLYTKNSQLRAFTTLLKSDALANKYVKLNDDYFYLSRGHLTAKADFLYGSQQRATFYYVNVAPQWQIFNEENWNTLEQDTRALAANRNLDLTVYTGVWGISTLPDINNKLTPLYLYIDRNNVNHQLSVPEVFWKVLYDPKTNNGVALIGHNNPYESDVAKRPICKSVCDKIKWLNWHADNITEGYSYCCDVNDLKKVVTYLPEINIRGLLV